MLTNLYLFNAEMMTCRFSSFFCIIVVKAILLEVAGRICEHFNPSDCLGPMKCNLTQSCSEDNQERWHCYALWTNISGAPVILMKGCWLDKEYCYNKQRCTVTEVNKHNNFCCCDADMCNSDIDLDNFPKELIISTSQESDTNPHNSRFGMLKKILLMSLCPLLILALIIILTFYIWRKFLFRASGYKTPSFQAVTIEDKILEAPKVELLEIVADGCFGPIWKGKLDGRFVAIKVMSQKGEKMWKTERDFYNIIGQATHNDNILKFVRAEAHHIADHENHVSLEFWLITEFHQRGSLRDNLKKDTFTLKEVVSIVFTISKGLAFLHSSSKNLKKLPVAHRDLKSENILLKEDLTACIADFGLSLTLRQNLTNVHGQVGSVRYMAPEVLDGAMNSNVESFLKTDIYSCSLIFWEVLSRCSAIEGSLGDYLRPFEVEVGLHPSIEDMQFLILSRKERPNIKKDWWNHDVGVGFLKIFVRIQLHYHWQILREVCRTMEDCWDHDAEARLTAEAVEQRLSQLCQKVYAEHSSPT